MASSGKRGGWTFFRVIGIAIAGLGMAAFGLCSAVGLIATLGTFVMVIPLIGGGMTYLCYRLFRHITNLVDGDHEDRSSVGRGSNENP